MLTAVQLVAALILLVIAAPISAQEESDGCEAGVGSPPPLPFEVIST